MSVIHILVHGLIALVPATDPGGTADHMTALLIDARNQPPAFTQCFAPHLPAIKVVSRSSAECQDAGCTDNTEAYSNCTCSLTHKEVSLQAQRLPEKANHRQKLNPRPDNTLPFDLEKASDISYVANLSRMGYELDRRFLDPHPPSQLIARMTFPFDSVSSCSLGTRRDEESENVHPMSFRPLGDLEEAGELSQALAQMVVATMETDQDQVALTFTDLGGGNTRTLVLAPNDGKYRIELLNMRTSPGGMHDLPPDDPCDGGVERDFAFFYELVKNPPSWERRPIPHVKYTRWKSVKDLAEHGDDCDQGGDHLPNSHPICAMATFIPSE